jgi:hypothetical protein
MLLRRASDTRGNGRPYTDVERARIHAVSTATRLAGGSLTRAAEALAAELNRAPSAIRVQLATMRSGVTVKKRPLRTACADRASKPRVCEPTICALPQSVALVYGDEQGKC